MEASADGGIAGVGSLVSGIDENSQRITARTRLHTKKAHKNAIPPANPITPAAMAAAGAVGIKIDRWTPDCIGIVHGQIEVVRVRRLNGWPLERFLRRRYAVWDNRRNCRVSMIGKDGEEHALETDAHSLMEAAYAGVEAVGEVVVVPIAGGAGGPQRGGVPAGDGAAGARVAQPAFSSVKRRRR